MKKLSSRELTLFIARIALLCAVSVIFMYIMKIPFYPPFQNMFKLDFADVPVLIAALHMGPFSGVLVAAVKCLIYLPVDMGNTAGVGILSNFICCTTYALVTGFTFKILKKTPINKIIAAITALFCGLIALVTIACLSNWFLIFPLFKVAFNIDVKSSIGAYAIWGGVVPFNFIKGGLTAAIAFPLYKALDRITFRINNINNAAVQNDNQPIEQSGNDA